MGGLGRVEGDSGFRFRGLRGSGSGQGGFSVFLGLGISGVGFGGLAFRGLLGGAFKAFEKY